MSHLARMAAQAALRQFRLRSGLAVVCDRFSSAGVEPGLYPDSTQIPLMS